MKVFKYLITVAIAFVLVGCGLSDQSVNEAKRVNGLIGSAEKNLVVKKDAFLKDKKTKELQSYVEKENLLEKFNVAKNRIEASKTIYTKQVAPIIKEDDSDKEGQLNNLVGNMRRNLVEVGQLIQVPQNRIDELYKMKQSMPDFIKKATVARANVTDTYEGFTSYVNSMATKYPDKKTDLATRHAKVKAIFTAINNSFDLMNSEAGKGNDTDLTAFSKYYKEVLAKAKDLETTIASEKKVIAQLDTSYSKILADMKEVNMVKVCRVSWDEYYDFPTETTYCYKPKEVSDKVAQYFDTVVGENTLGTLGGGLFSSTSSSQINTRFNQSYVNNLGLNSRQSLPSGDDSAEFWVDNVYTDFYHKYIIIENGHKKETGWVKVDGATYEKMYDNLGMEIVSKPYGFYENEKITVAAPAGMSYVGNSRYGEWKKDPSTGHSFWYYYGIYSFMNDLGGSHHYYRSDYDTYRTYRHDRRNYYGGGVYGTYGTRTYSAGSRYKSTTFANSNSRVVRDSASGKFKSSSRTSSTSKTRSSTVRNSGSNSRGRGPGGGGK